MKRIVFGVMAAALGVFAAEPASQATVTVDLTREIGPIKPMHAVNNGPSVSKPGGDQLRGNFEDYKAARIPFARLHDSINCVSGGAHSVDVNAIFCDFDADENDPANYDFVFTDHYLDTIRRAGTEVYFRLGQTIEHGPKKYGALPADGPRPNLHGGAADAQCRRLRHNPYAAEQLCPHRVLS